MLPFQIFWGISLCLKRNCRQNQYGFKTYCDDTNPILRLGGRGKISDANLPLFGGIRRFLDQMGHFCKSSRTDEKIFVVWRGGWATVNARSLLKV